MSVRWMSIYLIVIIILITNKFNYKINLQFGSFELLQNMIATTIGNFSKQFCKYLLLKGPLIWHGQKQRKDRSDKVKPIKIGLYSFP